MDALVCILAIVAYVFAAEAEAFEEFYYFSRSHEDWDLDEIVLIYAIAAAVLPFLLFRANKRLRSAIREASDAKSRAQHVARHDALTGLFSRRYFYELLEDFSKGAAKDRFPIVLLMDLDRFKAVNDLRGHEGGDNVLQEISNRILTCCEGKHHVARLGGDEFAILVSDASDLTMAASLARRLLTVVNEPMLLGDWSATVGCSIGIGHWHEGSDASAIIRNADQAMYKAKSQGRGRYAFFDQDLGEEVQQQAQLEAELKVAAERNDIEPYFQPIIDMENFRICGFEILSRWTSPTFGAVPPDQFIQIAEDMGLIGAITWDVMHKALTVATDWDDDLFMAFNLSPRLFDEDLLGKIEHQLDASRFPADRLEIEITENAVIGNIDQAREALNALKELGIRVSLDDFGTGFSSLATLSKLPFDKIKIDRSFVSEVEETPQNAKIVNAILALAQSMQIDVTAEGIETHKELNFLSGRACPHGQGFLFAKPMQADDVTNYLKSASGAVEMDAAREAS